MLATIRNTLPSGLTRVCIGDEALTQRVEYPSREPNIISPPTHEPMRINSCRKTTTRVKPLMEQIIPHFDELLAYSDTMIQNSERYLIDKMMNFIGNAPGCKLFGGKKGREIMAYLSNPRRNTTYPPDAFFLFLSFLLDAQVVVNEKQFVFNEANVSRTITLIMHKK